MNIGIGVGNAIRASFLFVTFGTAVYRHLATDKIVSNCHKIPRKNFPEIISVEEIVDVWQPHRQVKGIIRVFFSKSVRHGKMGHMEPNQQIDTFSRY